MNRKAQPFEKLSRRHRELCRAIAGGTYADVQSPLSASSSTGTSFPFSYTGGVSIDSHDDENTFYKREPLAQSASSTTAEASEPQQQQQQAPRRPKPLATRSVHIFQDDSDAFLSEAALPVGPGTSSLLPTPSVSGPWPEFGHKERNKENVREATTWKGVTLPSSRKLGVPSNSKKVQVYEDEVPLILFIPIPYF